MKPKTIPLRLVFVTCLILFPVNWMQPQSHSIAAQDSTAVSGSEWKLSERLLTSQLSVRPAVADLDRDGNPELLVGYNSIGWLPERPQHLYRTGDPKFVELASERGLKYDKHNDLLIFPGVSGGAKWDWSRARWLKDETRLVDVQGG